MKVGVIGTAQGVHESRFLRAFCERGIEAVFVGFDELSHENRQLHESSQVDFFFGGPLHQGLRIAPSLLQVPFVAVSYAFDVLYEAARDSQAAAGVTRMLDSCRGLLVDCEAVTKAISGNFGYSGPTLVRAWGLEQPPRPVMPSGTSRQSEWENLPSGHSIVSVRSFTQLHGIMDVVCAFGRAASKDPTLRLLMAGDGPLRDKVSETIDDMGLSDRVRLLGRIPECEMINLIRHADLYVSASVIDGTSISLLQALEAGVQVLLSNVGGNPEWVQRVEGAAMFEAGNWRQLGDLMAERSNHPGTCRFDRTAVLERHANWKRNADDIVDFCLRIAG